MCRKNKGTATVGVKVNLYTAKLECLLIVTDRLTSSKTNWFAPAVPPGRGSLFGEHQGVCSAEINMGGRGEQTAE